MTHGFSVFNTVMEEHGVVEQVGTHEWGSAACNMGWRSSFAG